MSSEYIDVRCEDDLDPFAREVGPLEALEQSLLWMLRESQGSHVFDPEYGLNLEDYIGRPLPSNLSSAIEAAFEEDDRVLSASCTIQKRDGAGEVYDITVEVQATEGFLRIAYAHNAPVEQTPADPATTL